MLNLAPLRYAKVMCSQGGPIARMEHAPMDVFGEACVHAVTYLEEGIVDAGALKLRATVQPDGAGCHTSAQVACYMAISEAMERWAVYYCREHAESGLGAMALDSSSNGFAAYPGLFRRQARAAAYRESIERHCLICWWEGLLGHRCVADPWPGVNAIEIDNPFSSHSVVLLWANTVAGTSYAFGAGSGFDHAARRALVEMERTQCLLELMWMDARPYAAGVLGDVFERRIRYFSQEAGSAMFLQRLKQRVCASAPPPCDVLFDAAVTGPWDRYSSVWRTVIEAPSRDYLSQREDYFFW